jgi:hypothetical protein
MRGGRWGIIFGNGVGFALSRSGCFGGYEMGS